MEKRNIVMQLLGCLMKNPLFLGEVNTYNLTPNDFSRPMDKQIFAAIYNLFSGGAEKIAVVDIDNYLKTVIVNVQGKGAESKRFGAFVNFFCGGKYGRDHEPC